MRNPVALLAAATLSLALVSAPLSGCSSRTKTTTTTREEVPVSAAPAAGTPAAGTVVTETTQTETTSSGAGCSGVLSCTFAGIGWVIALPFRIVAGVIELIF